MPPLVGDRYLTRGGILTKGGILRWNTPDLLGDPPEILGGLPKLCGVVSENSGGSPKTSVVFLGGLPNPVAYGPPPPRQ